MPLRPNTGIRALGFGVLLEVDIVVILGSVNVRAVVGDII